MRGSAAVDQHSLATRGIIMNFTNTKYGVAKTKTNTPCHEQQATWPGAELFERIPKTKNKILITSLKEMEQISDEDLKAARLGGASRMRIKKHLETGVDYLTAKRLVIKENFLRNMGYEAQRKKIATIRPGSSQLQRSSTQLQRSSTQLQKSSTQLQKSSIRPQTSSIRPQTSSARPQSSSTRPQSSSTQPQKTSVEVAVVDKGFPGIKLSLEKLDKVKECISEAHDEIPFEGPQVRFAECTVKLGYLVFTCADRTSADWLRTTIPTLKLWEGASLRVLEGDELPGAITCTVFIPDENGHRPAAEKVLRRLRGANRGLNTDIWSVWESVPSENGQIWTFSMDRASLEELKRTDMSPYYNLGRIHFKFKLKQDGTKGGAANLQEEEAAHAARLERK